MSPTPLLDRQDAVPAQPPVKRARALVIVAAIGFMLLFVRDKFPNSDGGFTPSAEFAVFIASLFCGVLLHELGHVVAGIAVGFEFRRVMAGPWMLTKESR